MGSRRCPDSSWIGRDSASSVGDNPGMTDSSPSDPLSSSDAEPASSISSDGEAPTSPTSFGKALGYGLAVALISGAAWAAPWIFAQDFVSPRVLGMAAWGIGILVGLTLMTVAGMTCTRVGLAALLLTALGLALGRGLTYRFHKVPLYFVEFEDTTEASEALDQLTFKQRFGLGDSGFDGYEWLGIFLALGTAWKIGRGMGSG